MVIYCQTVKIGVGCLLSKAPHEEEAADDEKGYQMVMPFVFEE